MSWSPCVVGRALMSHKVRRMHQAQLKTVRQQLARCALECPWLLAAALA